MPKTNAEKLHERYVHRRTKGLCCDCGKPVKDIYKLTGEPYYACNDCRSRRSGGSVKDTVGRKRKDINVWRAEMIEKLLGYKHKTEGELKCHCGDKSFMWHKEDLEVYGECEICGIILSNTK